MVLSLVAAGVLPIFDLSFHSGVTVRLGCNLEVEMKHLTCDGWCRVLILPYLRASLGLSLSFFLYLASEPCRSAGLLRERW